MAGQGGAHCVNIAAVNPGTLLLLASATLAVQQSKVELQPSDTIPAILERQVGRSVELRLKSGEKLVGKLQRQNDELVHLSALVDAEFYDAVVCVDDIAAVLVRTKAR